MMKKILCAALGAAVGAIGLVACDEASTRSAAVSQPVESEAAPVAEPAAATRPSDESAGPEAAAAAKAIDDAMRDRDAFARARKLATMLPTFGQEAVPAVEKTLSDPTVDYEATEVELLVRFWATQQPAEASRWAAIKAPWRFRPSAILAAFEVWAEADPQAARDGIERWGTQPGEVHNAMEIALVRGWFKNNPTELAQYIREVGVGVQRQRLLSVYLHEMIQTDGPEAAVRWAEARPDEDRIYKMTVFRKVGAALPLFDHEAALRFCETHCDGPFGNNLRSVIARRWVLYDAPAAFEWLSNTPEGAEKESAVRGAFTAWGAVDREAALDWMATQTAGGSVPSWLQPALQVYAMFLSRTSPAEAIKWAEQIEVDDQRRETMIRVAQRWREQDPEAADAWLLKSPLSEQARARVRAPRPGQPPPAFPPGLEMPPEEEPAG